MFTKIQKASGETENRQGGGFSRLLKAKNKLLQTKFSQAIFQRGVTVFCCVCIIVFGITLLSKADPITTSIGQDISTNNLSLSGSVTSGTWAGSSIDVAHGGTGQNWSAGTHGSLPFFSGTGAFSTLTPGTAGQFLQSGGVGANPSWGNVTRSATFVVGASNSSTKSKQEADYVCDGTDDQVEIQAAIDSLPASGGSILFLEGTFVLDAPNDFYISGSKYALNVHGNNVELIGSQGMILKLKDGINVGNGAANTFVSTIIISGNNISIKNIRFNNILKHF